MAQHFGDQIKHRARPASAPASAEAGSASNAAPSPSYTLAQAFELHRAGRLDEARRRYEDILTRDPRNPDATKLCGLACFQLGESEEAAELLQKAEAIAPGDPDIPYNLGIVLLSLSRLDAAESAFRRALASRPDHAAALNNLGSVLRQAGRHDEAEAACRRAIEADPGLVDAQVNLGIVLTESERFAEAEVSLRRAVSIAPESAQAHDSLGLLLNALERFEEAEAAHRQALELAPESAAAYYNLGVVLKEQWKIDEAGAAYRQALEISPEYDEVHNNLGTVMLILGRIDEAESAYRRAIEITPDYADAHFNLSVILCLTGRLAEGWSEYEWRWRRRGVDLRPFGQPMWDGTPLDGRTILAWAEQGIGDEIQFAGLIPDLMKSGASIVVECAPRLVPLFTRSFAGVEVVPRQDPPLSHLDDPSIDFQVPMGSLCKWFRSDLSRFPERRGYLLADEDRVRDLRGRYDNGGGDLVVGIAWRNAKRDTLGKIAPDLMEWNPIFRVPGFRFVNLQFGDTHEERAAIKARTGHELIHDTEIDPLVNLDDFAAQVAALDLVISTDNSTVAVAGALGVPVWTLVSAVPSWIWMQDREDSPWYPTMRLFRQTERGDWSDVFERLCEELRRFRRQT